MAVQIKMTLDSKRLRKSLLDLGRNGTEIAANQALNRTLTGIRTDATKFLAEKSQVKRSGPIRKGFLLKKSTRQNLSAKLITPPMSLALSNQKGVRVVGRKGNKRVSWRGKQIKAFRIKGSVGGLKNDLFVRVPGRKSPQRAYSFTLLQEYRKNNAERYLRGKSYERLNKEFDRAFKNQLRRRGFK